MTRNISIYTPLGDDLKFCTFSGEEELSNLFEFTLELQSDRRDLVAADMLGQSITIEIELRSGAKRHLNGQCTRFNFTGVADSTGRFYKYKAILRSWLWYATRSTDYKVFQKMDVPSIVKDRLSKYPFAIDDRTTAAYPVLDYTVQYRESDFNFVSRLMENEGIYYFFEHSMGEHIMVLCDAIAAHAYYPDYELIPFYAPDMTYSDDARDHFDHWLVSQSVDPGIYATDEFDFKKPKADLSVDDAYPRPHNHSGYENFEFPGGYTDPGIGDHYAEVRMQELQNGNELIQAQGSMRGAAVGFLFALENHKREDQNREYLIVKVRYNGRDDHFESAGSGGAYHYHTEVVNIPTTENFRPKRITPKPKTYGSESAIITGPKGEEIYTDPYGRVKLQFHWDRYGTWDENSSCWIRVSSPWAGSNFGGIFIPRIGQEVLVDFINGNPDRPMVVHRVYNEDNMPPWDLPANDTQSGFLTRSTRGGAAGPGLKDGAGDANAMRFDDRIGEEQLWIHAQLDQLTEVENDEEKWVGRDRKKDIDRDETSTIGRDRTETVMHDETITVHHDRTETVDNNEIVSIGVNQTFNVGSNRTKSVGKNEKDSIGKSWSINVGKYKTETIGMAYMQNVGLGRMENVGLGYNLNVGMVMATVVGLNKSTTVVNNQSVSVGANQSVTVGETFTIDVGGGSNITMDEGAITLRVGDSSLIMKKDGTITLSGKDLTFFGENKILSQSPQVRDND
jgi:type VI secretion system secreted protein VgrG